MWSQTGEISGGQTLGRKKMLLMKGLKEEKEIMSK